MAAERPPRVVKALGPTPIGTERNERGRNIAQQMDGLPGMYEALGLMPSPEYIRAAARAYNSLIKACRE